MPKATAGKVAVLAMKPFGGGRILQIGPCLRFLRSYPNLIPCVGVDSVAQMTENIDLWDKATTGADTYNDTDMRILEDQRRLLGDRFCRMCGYCLPCPEEIPIPTVNFLKVFSMQMPRDQVVTDCHSSAVGKALGCTDCRQCVERCPYDLEIPDLLKENIEFYREFISAE